MLIVVAIFVLGLCAGLAVLGYFAYLLESGPPEHTSVAGLQDDTVVRWSSDGAATVEAGSLRDAWLGLGYAQAAGQPWPLTLYRAAALGNLAAMIGEEGLEVDRITVALQLGQGARGAFETLSREEREHLEAFASGVNAGLADKRILRDPAMILARAEPEPWEAWHSIAVERLFAWLAAETSSTPTVVEPVDNRLRSLLRLHDFEQSMIVLTLPPVEVGMYVRYVWGSSALPAVFETSLAIGERTIHGASLLGTPFLIAGRSGERMWAFLLSGRYERSTARPDSQSVRTERFRRSLPGGSETLITVLRDSSGVLIEQESADTTAGGLTVARVSWRGLEPITDAAAWFGLAEGREPTFDLIDGSGALVLDAAGQTLIGVGSDRLDRGVAFSNSGWKSFAIERLDTVMAVRPAFQPRIWFSDTFSGWAARIVPPLIASSDTSWTGSVEEAVTYLRNWDYTFDGSSIAAAIFASWAEDVRDIRGSWPLPEPVTTATGPSRSDVAVELSHRTVLLNRTVERMLSQYGPDMSTWRWERVNASAKHYPILGSRRGASARFLPVSVRGRGHPSTPEWGPAAIRDTLKPSHLWEVWAAATLDDWTYRRGYAPETHASGQTSVVSERGVAVSHKNMSADRQTTLSPKR